MKKIVLFLKNHAALICACILACILALSAVWLRSAGVRLSLSKRLSLSDQAAFPTGAPDQAVSVHPPALGEVIVPYEADALVFNTTTRVYETHPGTDFLCPDGRVYAVSDGRVTQVKNDPLYGLTVVLSLDNGDQAVYASLSEAHVKAGGRVKKGDVIGKCGQSALSEAEIGPHLHFEYLKNGKSHPIPFTTAPET